MKRYLLSLAPVTIALLVSCYKAKMVSPKQGPPVFDVYVDGLRLDSSTNTLGPYFPQYGFLLDFRLVSGTPTDYSFDAYFTDLPFGVTCSFDTLTFKLNYHSEFTIKAPNFYGRQTAYLHVSNPTLGAKVYPISFRGQ